MPELPDVEVFKRYLDASGLHQLVRRVDVRDDYVLKEVSPEELAEVLEGEELASSRRHGKYLFVEATGGPWLVFHFGMTGFFRYYRDPDHASDYPKVVLDYENGYHLAFDCRRKLGEVRLTPEPEAFVAEKKLGPDAMSDSFDQEAFRDAVGDRRGMIKTALMNQQAMAGVGNEYSEEALYQAGVHPRTPVSALDDDALDGLYRTLREVMATAIECRVEPERMPDDFIIMNREPGSPCPRCGTAIERIEVSGRGTYVCPGCQPEP